MSYDPNYPIDPENDPTGILWILVRDVKVTSNGNYDAYKAEELDGNGRVCVISRTPAGRMLFDDQDIETEDFMAYVGMLDEADQSPNGCAIFRNDIVSYSERPLGPDTAPHCRTHIQFRSDCADCVSEREASNHI